MQHKLSEMRNFKNNYNLKGKIIRINCDACSNEYEIKVIKEDQEFRDFRIICCLFCGQQIKFY